MQEGEEMKIIVLIFLSLLELLLFILFIYHIIFKNIIALTASGFYFFYLADTILYVVKYK